MLKKYLTNTSVTDNREAIEYELLAGATHFTIQEKDSRNRATIPYSEFEYPEFISEERIFKEIAITIITIFEKIAKGKAILINYSEAEQLRIQQIIYNNKKEYNL